MFKNMKLGTKLYCGFGVMVIIAGVLGYTGWSSLGNVIAKIEMADDANRFIEYTGDARQSEKNFMLRRDQKYAQQVEDKEQEFVALAKETKGKLQVAEDKSAVDTLAQQVEAYTGASDQYVALEHQKTDADGQMAKAARAVITQIEQIRADQEAKLLKQLEDEDASEAIQDRLAKADDANRLNKFILEARRHEGNYIIRGDQEYIDKVLHEVAEMLSLAKDMKNRFNDPANQEQADKVIAAVQAYKNAFDTYGTLIEKQKQEEEKMVAAARAVQDDAAELRKGHKDKMDSAAGFATSLMLGLAGGAVILGCILAWVITRGITKPINRIIAGLTEGANQVTDAAGQVSSASQELAEGASEQASSLEETSSALEEMAAMTRINAENAKQANELATQTRSNADEGDKTMGRLNDAMNGINESSGRISKVIKVIEEVAFQTNLLALNAAVEAARAGEHGKGFAVVADEVRNLAMRSAEAARETTELIEDSVTRAKEGSDVAGAVTKALSAIVGDVGKVAELINGITRASQEQAQGVEQINTAVAQMDKVTQQNAAGAEESASAAEQLSAQAETVNGMVADLEGLVHGTSASHRPGSGTPAPATGKPKKTTKPALHHHMLMGYAAPMASSARPTGPGDATREASSVAAEFEDF